MFPIHSLLTQFLALDLVNLLSFKVGSLYVAPSLEPRVRDLWIWTLHQGLNISQSASKSTVTDLVVKPTLDHRVLQFRVQQNKTA